MRLRRPGTRQGQIIRQTQTQRAERPADELSRQGSVWERTVTAAVAVMGNGDGRLHSTKADTSRCSLEMTDSSRDCRPSRTSHAGPAAPGQRPCTSTHTLDPWADLLVQHRAILEPMSISTHPSHPINDDGSIHND